MDVKAMMEKLASEERELRRQLSELKRKRQDMEGQVEVGGSGELQAVGSSDDMHTAAGRSDEEPGIIMSAIEPTTRDEEKTVSPRKYETVMQQLPPVGHLPDELIVQITQYVSIGTRSQQALATCCLISRRWYNAAIEHLYRHPKLSQSNINPFVSIICPSYNVHVRQSPLSAFVKVLDMSKITSTGTKNATARLLGRTKDHLEEFRAPRTAASVHLYSALGKCLKLRVLDLTFCSESPTLPKLLKGISAFTSLTTLRLPRSSGFGVQHKQSSFENSWPPYLTDLTISGGIDAHFLHGVAKFPQTLTHLTVEHCPLAKPHAVVHLLKYAVQPLRNLKYFKIAHMARLGSGCLDEALLLLPQISTLSISVDYFTKTMFDEGHIGDHDHSKVACPTLWHTQLRTLELTNSSGDVVTTRSLGMCDPMCVEFALADSTPNLRLVRVAQSLGWQFETRGDWVESLNDELHEAAHDDWKKRKWIFADMDEGEYWRENCWKTYSGIQIFAD